MIGRTILHYQILEKFGEGEWASSTKPKDTKLQRTVALKFLPRQIAASKEELERFKFETQVAAVLLRKVGLEA